MLGGVLSYLRRLALLRFFPRPAPLRFFAAFRFFFAMFLKKRILSAGIENIMRSFFFSLISINENRPP